MARRNRHDGYHRSAVCLLFLAGCVGQVAWLAVERNGRFVHSLSLPQSIARSIRAACSATTCRLLDNTIGASSFLEIIALGAVKSFFGIA